MGYQVRIHVVKDTIEFPYDGILGHEFLNQTGGVVNYKTKEISIGDSLVQGKLVYRISMDPEEQKRFNGRISRLCPKAEKEMEEEYEDHLLKFYLPPIENVFEGENKYKDYSQVNHIAKKYEALDAIKTNEALKTLCSDDIEEYFVFPLRVIVEDPEQIDVDFDAKDMDLPEDNITRVEDLQKRCNIIHAKLKTDHLKDKEEINHVNQLVEISNERFYIEGDEFSGINYALHRIRLQDDYPVQVKGYRLPHNLREIVNKEIEKFLKNGIIRPSKSPYSAPVWCMPKKKDNSGKQKWRVVIDYRKLNEKTIQDPYPLPYINMIFDQLAGAKYFMDGFYFIDFHSGFYHVRIHLDDIHKTGFSTEDGHYEFLRLAMGLCNSPSTFQRAVDECLRGLIGHGVFCFIDDVIIYASTLEEHEKLFKKVIERLIEYNFKIQIDKCDFLTRRVTYLGHIISEKGLEADPRKVEAVKLFSIPKTQRNVREFLGLAIYYGRFIKGFAKMAKFLTNLLKKDAEFIWDENCQAAFEALKNALVPIFPDFSKPFIIRVDASKVAVGAVLSQGKLLEDKPIAYASRMFRGAEAKYDSYDQEALAMVFGIKQFRHYVYGTRFTVVTDCEALLWFKKTDGSPRIQKWRFLLSDYDFDIIHSSGKNNQAADALSRNSIEVNVVTRAQRRELEPPEPEKQPTLPEPAPEKETSKAKTSEPHKSPALKKRGRPRKNSATTDPTEMQEEDENPAQAPPKKRGRTRKSQTLEKEPTPSSSSSESSDEELEEHDIIEIDKRVQEDFESRTLIHTKESILQRRDNLVFLMDPTGKAVDRGAQQILSRIAMKKHPELTPNDLVELKFGRNHAYGLCIKVNQPITEVKESLKVVFFKLRGILRERNRVWLTVITLLMSPGLKYLCLSMIFLKHLISK